MFEKELGCDPMTDHITAKDIYPLYDSALRRCLDAYLVKARAEITEVFNNELEMYNKLINDNND